LTLGPAEIGAIRLAGVSLAWWYIILVAPGLAVLLTLRGTSRAAPAVRTPAEGPRRRDRSAVRAAEATPVLSAPLTIDAPGPASGTLPPDRSARETARGGGRGRPTGLPAS
jgi:hypothetical protein